MNCTYISKFLIKDNFVYCNTDCIIFYIYCDNIVNCSRYGFSRHPGVIELCVLNYYVHALNDLP